MKKLFMVSVLAAAVSLSAGDVLLKDFSKEIKCGEKKYGSVKTELVEGGGCFTILQKQDEKKDPTHVQLICAYPEGLKAETSYKITFTAQCSVSCEFSGGIIGDKSPWTYFLRKWWRLEAGTPRNLEIVFTPEKNTGAVRTPCLFLGDLPVGCTFTLSQVKLYEVQ